MASLSKTKLMKRYKTCVRRVNPPQGRRVNPPKKRAGKSAKQTGPSTLLPPSLEASSGQAGQAGQARQKDRRVKSD
jgi:hypothetical protein